MEIVLQGLGFLHDILIRCENGKFVLHDNIHQEKTADDKIYHEKTADDRLDATVKNVKQEQETLVV